ncbi:hypothetical protein CLV58_13511 [Spirosoma oryzae]|uniref:Uncharacterized protein n=1 Tax=Spirosoma oryzae TaxID=1469603 RepID=A0A2T0S0Q3_9BACT|nr:hypothetical protein CLV58_13511 [Spirosoma oryzae]
MIYQFMNYKLYCLTGYNTVNYSTFDVANDMNKKRMNYYLLVDLKTDQSMSTGS